MQTATFDAAVGNTAGGVTNLSIKSGTNSLHGTMYYAFQRKDFWANDFYNNKLGNPPVRLPLRPLGRHGRGTRLAPQGVQRQEQDLFHVRLRRDPRFRPRYDAATTPNVPTEAMSGTPIAA